LAALWEETRYLYINYYPFKWVLDVVLMYVAPIPGTGAATGCTNVTAGTTSQHHFLPGASSRFAVLYS
jgi:hypothetical protein